MKNINERPEVVREIIKGIVRNIASKDRLLSPQQLVQNTRAELSGKYPHTVLIFHWNEREILSLAAYTLELEEMKWKRALRKARAEQQEKENTGKNE